MEKNNKPRLIVMLTHNDFTVNDAESLFEECKIPKAKYWGIKEQPLPVDTMKRICDKMKEC